MKFNKLFSVLALSLMTLTMSAAITSKATLKVQSGYGPYDLLYLYEDNSETQLVDDILNTVNAASVNLYAVIDDANYSSVKQASLTNLPLVFKANSLETSYTVTFSDVVGNISVKLGENTYVAEDGGSFMITCEASALVDLIVNPAAPAPEADYTRSVTSGNWGTICLPKASSSFSGMALYTVAGYVAADNVIALDPMATDQMVAGMPYFFQASAEKIEVFYAEGNAEEAPVEGANHLTGTFEDIPSVEGLSYIVKDNLLWQADGAHVAANRAYIALEDITEMAAPAPAAPGRKFIAVPKAMPTGMQEVKAMNGTRKAIVNGRLVIIREGRMFDALGAMK